VGINTFFFSGALASGGTRVFQPPAGENWILGSGTWVYGDGGGFYLRFPGFDCRVIGISSKDYVQLDNTGLALQTKIKYWFNNANPLVVRDTVGGGATRYYAVSGVKLPALAGAQLIRQQTLITVGTPTNVVTFQPPTNKVWVVLALWGQNGVATYVTDGTNSTAKTNVEALVTAGLGIVCTQSLYWGLQNNSGSTHYIVADILEIDAASFPATVGQLINVSSGSELKMQPPAGETWRIHSPYVEPNSFYARAYEAGALVYSQTNGTVNWSAQRTQYADNQNYPSVYNFSVGAKWYGYTGFKLP
jgi:hypothetical protein